MVFATPVAQLRTSVGKLHCLSVHFSALLKFKLKGKAMRKHLRIALWTGMLSLCSPSLQVYAAELPAVPVTVPIAGHCAGVSDFNADGYPDIASVDGSPAMIHLYRHNGKSGESYGFIQEGSFGAGTGQGTIGPLLMRDVDLNGQADIIVAYVTQPLLSLFLRNDKSNGQTKHLDLTIKQPATALAATDIDMQGEMEIIAAVKNEILISGLADGELRILSMITLPCAVLDLKVADMNGDGLTDIVAGTAKGLSILFNSGSGSTQNTGFTPASNIALSQPAHSLDIGDMNGDFIPDIVTGNYPFPNVTCIANMSSGSHVFFDVPVVLSSHASFDVALCEINGDGLFDIISSVPDNKATPGCTFINMSRAESISMEPGIMHSGISGNLTIADFNGDNKDDVVTEDGIVLPLGKENGQQHNRISGFLTYCNEEGAVSLEWRSEKELPGTEFIIERSVDGSTFTPVLSISGSAPDAGKTYSANVENVSGNRLYFRVRNVSLGQVEEISDLQLVESCDGASYSFSTLYDHSRKTGISLSVNSARDLDISYTVFDENCRSVNSGILHAIPGTKSFAISVEGLAHGKYWLSVQSGNDLPAVEGFEIR